MYHLPEINFPQVLHTPPFRPYGMAGDRLFNRTPSTKMAKTQLRAVGSTDTLYSLYRNMSILHGAVLRSHDLLFHVQGEFHAEFCLGFFYFMGHNGKVIFVHV